MGGAEGPRHILEKYGGQFGAAFCAFFILSVPSSGCQKLIGRLVVIFHKMCVRARLSVRVLAVESAG